jgi:hypothetical protein
LPLAVLAKGECAVKKIFKITAGLTPVILVLTLFCSNPVKDVAWRTSIDLPITANKKFILAAMMDTLFFNKQQVLFTTTYDTLKVAGSPNVIDTIRDTTMMILKAYPLHDSANKPISETVIFGVPTRDTASDTISEDSLADKYYSDAFGPLQISGAPNDTITVPLAGAFTAATPIAPPATPVTLKYIYHIQLTNTAQSANVTVVNNSGATFSAVAITAGSLGPDTIRNLQPNASGTAHLNAQNKVIDSVMNLSVAVTPSTSGAFVAGNNMKIIFSFGGLTASTVVANDSLFSNYSRTFTNMYKLTDTVDVSYIDIQNGFFNYTVTNYTGLDMQISVTHRNLWQTDFCIRHKPTLASVNDLVGLTLADSQAAYGGEVTPPTAVVDFPAGQTDRFSKSNISLYRMFPEWEWNPYDNDSESVTKVDYNITVGLHGRRVTLNSGDSLNFVIRTTSFKFNNMFGRSTAAYHRTSDPKNIPVNLPWSKTVTDSLRQHFILQKVYANVATTMNIPAGAFIDTMHIFYKISTTDSSVVTADSQVFNHVTRESTYVRSVDITKVVNDYPDSVRINVAATIPINTTLKAVNDLTDPNDPTYTHYVGRMIIHALANYNLMAPLRWTVSDTTVMDLGGAHADLGGASGVLDLFEKMRDRHDSLNMKVTNFTNVDLKLYALAAVDTSKIGPLVDTGNANYINTNTFTSYLNNPPAGFINLLGSGVWIPPRDSTRATEDKVVISDADLGKITSAKKMGLRWEVRFLPHASTGTAPVPDSLSNTDWIKLNSWIHIDGVNSIDSLIK